MNIIIISYRRSGTHLTIDSLINNLQNFKEAEIITLEKILQTKGKSFSEELQTTVDTKNRIFKTHFVSDFNLYALDLQDKAFLNNFFENNLKIYVYRNCFDVMVSLFHYMKNYESEFNELKFNDFIQMQHDFERNPNNLNRSSFWAFHIDGWKQSNLAKNILFIKYEDWISDFNGTLNKISKFTEIKLNTKIIDIRIKNSVSNNFVNKYWFAVKNKFYEKIKKQKRTAVSPRKGKVNDYVNYFNDNTYKSINKDVWKMMEELDYKIMLDIPLL